MSKHLVITIHGIQTYGQWTVRLGRLLGERDQEIETVNYNYGILTFIAFLIPPIRWLVTRRFRLVLLEELRRERWDRVDIVAHSFGTHLVGWALQSIRDLPSVKINTVIFAGSVLRTRFRWDHLIPSCVGRLVNECGIRDSALIFSQLFVLFTGMAGRVGFSGALGRRFQNRYFNFGHSGYFIGDEFMRERWVPLLVEQTDIVPVDERRPLTVLRGVGNALLNNAEPIKLSSYFGILVGILVWISGLLLLSEVSVNLLEKQIDRANGLLAAAREQLVKTLIGVGRSKLRDRPHEAVRYAEAAAKLTQGLEPADLLSEAVAEYPVFNRIVPIGARLDGLTLDTGYQTGSDEFAVDEEARIVIGLRSAADVSPQEEEGSSNKARVLVLRSTESGEEISSQRLGQRETFVTPEPSTTRLVMTRQGGERDFHLLVFDLSTRQLNPVLEIEHAATAANTNGGWPIFVLGVSGQVMQFDSATSAPRVSAGRWPRARELSVHPELALVAVLDSDNVVVLSKDALTEGPPFRVPGGSDFRLIWGPRQDTFLITRGERRSSRAPSLEAVYGSKTRPEPIWRSAVESFESGVRFVRTRRGSRIFLPDKVSREESPVVRVIDIGWPDQGDNRTAPKIRVNTLSGTRPQTSFLEIHAIAATQDGRLAAVSQSVTRRGGTTLDTSQSEIWDLSVLDGDSNLVPQSILLRAGNSVVQRSAITNDLSRLVLWDTSKIAHVFILDRSLQDRIRKPSTKAMSERYVHVDFGRTGRRVYDLETGTPISWPAKIREALSNELELDGSKMFVVDRGGVTLTLAAGAVQRFDAGLELIGAATRGDAWLLYSNADALLFDTNTMTRLGQLPRSPELAHLIENLRVGASYTSIQKGADGSFSMCMRIKNLAVECWVFAKSQNATWTARNTLSYPFAIDPKDEFVLAKLNRPKGLDVIFIASVMKDSDRNWKYRFDALSVSKGTPVSDYVFPTLPRDFRGIEWSYAGKDHLTLMSFYGGGDWHNAFCTFPRQGGQCEKWVPLPTYDQVGFTITAEDGLPLVLMLGFSEEQQIARLVRASDGKEQWSGKLLRPSIVPSLAPDGPAWSSKNLAAWRSVSRDVALGGDPKVFEAVTRLNADDLDVKAIEDISGQKPETFTRVTPYQLVKLKLRSLVGLLLEKLGLGRLGSN